MYGIYIVLYIWHIFINRVSSLYYQTFFTLRVKRRQEKEKYLNYSQDN